MTIAADTLIGKGEKSLIMRARVRVGESDRQPASAAHAAASAQIAPFIADLEARRVSPATVRAYRSDLVQLMAWLHEQRMTAAHLSTSVCQQYGSELAMGGAAPSTIARKLTSLRAFVAFLAESGAVEAGIADAVHGPARKKSLPLVPSQEEVVRILDAARQAVLECELPSGFEGEIRGEFRRDFQAENRAEICQRIRDRALLELLYGCGLRNAEACGLRLADIRRDQGLLIIRGKGEKTRMVPYAPATLEAIDAWLAIRPDSRTDHVLLTTRQNPLGTSDVRRIVRAAGKRAGVAIHPHTLRHACATHLMEQGADVRMIQEFLGHSSITTTQLYTHVSETQLKRVYLDAHPRAKENG